MLRAACDELWRRSVQGTSPEEIQQWSRRAATVRRQIVELADAYEDALHEQAAGHVVARRIERMTRPHQKRLEREQKRAQGGLYAGEKRSPNRPTQVDVDPDAWTVVKANAIRNRKALAAVAGALLVSHLSSQCSPWCRVGPLHRTLRHCLAHNDDSPACSSTTTTGPTSANEPPSTTCRSPASSASSSKTKLENSAGDHRASHVDPHRYALLR